MRSPPFLRHTKHTTRGEDDAKFSYVVIHRGLRPAGAIKATSVPLEESEIAELEAAIGEPIEREVVEPIEPTEIGLELEWPRLVTPPLKRSGHIILEVCAASGQSLSTPILARR